MERCFAAPPYSTAFWELTVDSYLNLEQIHALLSIGID